MVTYLILWRGFLSGVINHLKRSMDVIIIHGVSSVFVHLIFASHRNPDVVEFVNTFQLFWTL